MKLIIATAVLALIGAALPVQAQAAVIHYDLNIPREPLDRALKQFAEQTGLQVARFSDVAQGTSQAGPVVGHFTTEEALNSLLAGSGLSYRLLRHRTIAIVRAQANGLSAPSVPGGPPSANGGAHQGHDQKAERSFSHPFPMADMAQGAAPGASAMTKSSQYAGDQGNAELQEVIVTAQKYRQREFDVPISMTVIGGAELQRLGITDLDNLQFFVPGLYVDNAGTALRITIQGISNIFGQAALVGTYLDDADVTSQGFFGLNLNTYDLARVEVLKGPQGTLYGEGSLGGTIRYITNKPSLNELQMSAAVTGLFDQYGAPESRIQGMINSPVIDGVLGVRIAADIDQGGGWVDQPAANRKNINSRNLADVRVEGRWQPREGLTIDVTDVIHRDTSGPYTNENPAGVYTQVFNLTTTPLLVDNYNITNLTLDFAAGPVTVVNSSTYFTHYNNEHNFGGSFALTPPPSPMFQDYWTSAPNIDESLSDELRLSNSGAGRWRWTVGGLFKRIDNSSPYFLYYFGLPGPPGTGLPAPPYPSYDDIYSNSKSVFADTNYRVLGRLVLGVGVRYFKDDENALLLGDVEREQAVFTSVDPRFYARYGISEDVNVYASVAKGFRSGGFNGDGFPQYQPEQVWNYDLGAKMRLMQGRVRLNSDVFFSRYSAYQIVGVPPPPSPPEDVTHNAGDVKIKGVEAAATWNSTGGWRLSVNGDYINGRFVRVAVLDSSHEVGDPMDDVPRYQVTASAERDFRWRGRLGFAHIDYTQRARAAYRNRSTGPWYYSQSDYMYLLGVRAGINWRSNLALGVLVSNLLNDRGFIGSDSMEAYALREQPRTFGVYFNANIE